jgi:hypothetical protein
VRDTLLNISNGRKLIFLFAYTEEDLLMAINNTRALKDKDREIGGAFNRLNAAVSQ